jgi:hypothetical protein
VQLKHTKGGRIILLEDPWKVSNLHRSALGLHKTPWKFLGPCNVALEAQGRRGRPESGELTGGLGRGSGWGGSRVHGVSI